MNAQERALTKAKEKVEMLLWENATGVAIAEITGTLRISKPLAISALKAIGAVEQNGLWLIVDDEPAPVEVAPGAKADTVVNENFTTELSGISGELVEPLSNPYELPESETVKVVHAEPDWANAPEGATHWHENEWVRWAGKRSTKHNIWDMDAWRDGAWVLDFWGWKGSYVSFLADGAIPRPKPLTQAVFNGMPPEYVWAAVDSNSNHGAAFVYTVEPVKHPNGHGYWVKADCDVSDAEQIGIGYDTTNWETSLIRRDTPQIEPPCDKTASDYSTVFDNIKGRVLSTIKAHNGATADRVRELTGMHPDDIADAVQYMVDHKQLVGRPLYFTTVYEVAA